MDKKLFIALALAGMLALGCLSSSHQPVSPLSNESGDSSTISLQVVNESFRLQSLWFHRNLTLVDLQTLRSLVENDSEFSDEFNELEWLVAHNYPKHVGHSLGSLIGIGLNQTVLCPVDSLSHVGLFMAANESALAVNALGDAKESIEPWERQVAAAQAHDPSVYPGSRELLAVMRKEIADADSGNVSAVIADSAVIDATGYC